MTPIQPILILGILSASVIYFRRKRSPLFDRIIVLAFMLIGILMVLFPTITTAVAHTLGVGRGVDLVIYLGLLVIAFFLALLYSEMRTFQHRLTVLSREFSLIAADRHADETKTPNEASCVIHHSSTEKKYGNDVLIMETGPSSRRSATPPDKPDSCE